MILLALNQKEFLVKLPLAEKYLNENESTYTASYGQKLFILGYVDQTHFSLIDPVQLTPSEKYASFNPSFDFSILKEDDFRDNSKLLSFILPRQSSFKIVNINAYYYNTLPDNSRRILIEVDNNYNTTETSPLMDMYINNAWVNDIGPGIALSAPLNATQFIEPYPTKIRFRFPSGYNSPDFNVQP
jgi:hypothetical protein